jgi:hypothetical protein
VLGGKLMTDEGSVGAALRLTMLNNKPAQRNFATGRRYIVEMWNDEARMSNDEGNPNDEPRTGRTPPAVFFVIRASTLIRHSSFGFRHFIVLAQATCSMVWLQPKPQLTCPR